MSFKKRLDLHTHTDHSVDGHHSAIFLCETAVEKGLRAIALTDHVEIDQFSELGFARAAKQSFFECAKARFSFRGQLLVCVGVELGQPTFDVKVAEQLLREYSYDVVIGSIHNLKHESDFWFLPYNNYQDQEIIEILRKYFDEILNLLLWGNFDVLAHLTYPLRYICGEHGRSVDLTLFQEQIDAILELTVKQKIALEINTSGLRQKLGKTMPDEAIIRRFRTLGGQRITLGSDAHFAEHIGMGLDEGVAIAQRAGFTHTTLFQGREAVPIEIS